MRSVRLRFRHSVNNDVTVDNKLNKKESWKIYMMRMDNQLKVALSKEEVEEAQKSADDTKAAEIQTIKDEVAEEKIKLEEELEKAKEELGKKDDKDKNFEALRKSKLTAEEKLEEFKTETDKKITELTDKLTSGAEVAKVNILIDKMVGDDVELKKKVQFHYNSFKDAPKDDEALKERIANSYILATGKTADDVLPLSAASSSGGTPPKPAMPDVGKLEDEGSKDVAKNLGISDDDLKTNKLI